MRYRSIVCLVILNFITLMILPLNTIADEQQWWNDGWSFRQEIIIPFDTYSAIAKYQPIDIHLEFQNPCWAKDELNNSIRVIIQDENIEEELDSQIYELEYGEKNCLTSCNIVFIIPENANGKERYFVYYDNTIKDSPSYVDHVSVEESYYFYEPIAGYPFESDYFKIIEDGFVIYIVSKEGEFMGYTTSQHVTKLKEKTTEVKPKNGELIASFEFRYYYGQDMMDYSSTSESLVSSNVLVDGNLMVEFGLISESENKDIVTTSMYKYYYCPMENKRIHAYVNHKINEELKVAVDTNTDGIYAKLQCGGVSSKSIQDLNFGEILPYLHLYNERGAIEEIKLDLDPEYIPNDYDIRLLNNNDDVDLGTLAWTSFDEGEMGKSHSIIFGSNSIIKSGVNERDGLQINAYELDYPHLPGIETNRACFEIGRNSFEIGGKQDLTIPKNFEVDFHVEFFSSESGGYKIVEDEALLFQELTKIKPARGEIITYGGEKQDGNKLTVIVHNAPSFPMGAAFSALTGRKISHITVELHKENKLIYSSNAVRFKLNSAGKNENYLKWFSDTFIPIDWANLSFFKAAIFENVLSGKYLIKVFRENSFLKNHREYLGFKIIDVNKDTRAHIFCKKDGLIEISVKGKNDLPVSSCEINIVKDDTIIASNMTDDIGLGVVYVPILNNYELKVYYDGFLVLSEKIHPSLFSKIKPLRKNIDLELSDFNLNVKDTWNLKSTIFLKPEITSNKMNKPMYIYGQKNVDNTYLFPNLLPSKYQLSLKYKSFSVKKVLEIPKQKELTIIFPAEFKIKLNTLDSRGSKLNDVSINLNRKNKTKNIFVDDKETLIDLPPAIYGVKVYSEDKLIGSRKLNILGDRSFDLITSKEPFYPIVITIIILLITSLLLILSILKKNYFNCVKILPISFVSTSLLYPWWILQGSTVTVETSTKMFIIPLELITITTSKGIIGGELAFLPDLFHHANSLIPIISLIGCFTIIVSVVFNKLNKKIVLSLLFLSTFFLASSIIIFSYSMYQLTEIGIGSFVGNGLIDVKIPGEESSLAVFSNWGPGIGFFLYLISIIFAISTILFICKKR